MTQNSDNQLLMERLEGIESTILSLCQAYGDMLKTVEANTNKIITLNKYCQLMRLNQDNLKYELLDPANSNKSFFYPKFRSDEESIRLIVEQGRSLARFGDGELAIAFHIPRQKFQRLDDELAKRIWEVLNADTPEKLLIAVANHYGSLERFNSQAAYGIRQYMTEKTREQHEKIIPLNRIYSDTYMTRPYVIYKDVFTDAPEKRFEALKQIWKNKRIIIVEGAQTRLGVGNDLFEQAKEIRRILAPATSSFDRYDDIYQECLRRGETADLFILAIGPSSGILAYDLTLQSYQAVDVGHIDLEYEWFLAGKGTRVAVPHKYNNEVEGGDKVEEFHDAVYDSQIIASFI